MDRPGPGKAAAPKKGFKSYQVHEMADAKNKESERLRQALKIGRNYEEGSHWKRKEERLKKQQDRDTEREVDRGRDERD